MSNETRSNNQDRLSKIKSTEMIDRTISNYSANHFMTDTLAKHLFFDRIFPLLPIKSNISTYQEVELNEFFLSCRAVILNVAIARDINSVVRNNLDLIELIAQNEKLTENNNINEDSLNSLLILVRLLSDTLEYYWESCGNLIPQIQNDRSENAFEKQRAYFKSFVVGFSTHRASLHLKRPTKLRPEIADRLINICIKLKCNTGTLKLLKNMSPNLHASKTLTFVHILPEYQKLISQLDSPILLEKTDLTIDYILRFTAASNREQFDSILKSKILEPFAIRHSVSELAIVEYLELFGCLFLTNRNLSHYLKMVRKITFVMKRTVFYSLLLYYFSKSFIFWIMARPKEYISLYEKLLKIDQTDLNDPIREIPPLINTLFEDVHSTFNVSNILTSSSSSSSNHHQENKSNSTLTPTTNNNNNESTHIPQSSTQPLSINDQLHLYSHHHTFSAPNSTSVQGREISASSDNKHNISSRNSNITSTTKPTISHPLAHPSIKINTKYPNPSIGQHLGHVSSGDIPGTALSSSSSIFPNPYSERGTPIGNEPTDSNNSNNNNVSVKSNRNGESKFERLTRTTSKNSTYRNSNTLAKQNPINKSRSPLEDSMRGSFIDTESTTDSTDLENEIDNKIEYDSKINAYYLENVLELYSTFNNSELLSNMAVFRFLVILTFLDTESIPEMNGLSFKGLLEVDDISSDNDEKEEEQKSVEKNNKIPFSSRRRTMSGSSDKERLQSIKHLAQGLKKITSLPTPSRKSRPGKFLIQLLAIVNGAQQTSNMVLVDAIRCLLSFMTVSSSISIYNGELPCIILTKRFYNLLGNNLDVGKDWNSLTNKHITHCRNKYPMISRRLKLEFFAAAVQLNPVEFLGHLQLESELKHLNLKKLCIYTEGFRVSLHLLNKDESRRKNVRDLSKFFQSLFSVTADILLKAYPYFDPKVTKIILSVLNGPILDVFESKRLSLLKLEKGESTTKEETRKEAQNMKASDERGNYWNIGEILPRISDNPTMNEFLSSESSLDHAGITRIQRGLQIPSDESFHILMPRAEHISSHSRISSEIQFSTPSVVSVDSKVNTPLPRRDEMEIPSAVSATATPELEATSTPNRSIVSSQLNVRSESNGEKSLLSPLMKATLNLQRYPSNKPTPTFESSSGSNNTNDITVYNNDARKIMMNIFSIFKRVSNYFVSPVDETLDAIWDSGNFRTVIKPIFVAMLDANILLQNSAESFMDILILYISDYTDFTDSTLFGRHFLLCSYTITLFSIGLSDMSLSNKKKKLLLNVVVKVLDARACLIRTARKLNLLDQVIFIDETTAPLLITSLGSALIMSMSCSEEKIPKLLRTGFRELDNIMTFYEENIGPIDKTCIFNARFIKETAASNYSSAGSVAFLRKLKNNIVKYVTHPDILVLESLNGIYDRWYYYSVSRYLNQQELSDFRSLAGIIASLSGVLFTIGDDEDAGFKEFAYLTDVKEILIDKLRYFIRKQCEWLNYPDLLTRENSRDIISVELHPLAYSLLFDDLNMKITDLKNTQFDETTDNLTYTLLEQIIIIMRTILKRDDEDRRLLLFSNGIVDAIEDLIHIIEKMPHESVLYFKAIIQISKMFISIEYSEESLAIKNHFLLKNKWINIVINWFKFTIAKDYDLENLAKPHREMDLEKRDLDFLYIDTSIESAKALAYLTKGIPLNTNYANTSGEFGRSELVTFANYFTILLKGLERSTNSERFPVSLKHKINILNENIIDSLTNLSNSNVDASLTYSLPMGYSDNKNIRIAFLKVFIDIVTNYPLLKSNDDTKKIIIMDKLLLHLMKHPRLTYKGSIVCPSNDTDEYAAGLIRAFETRNASHIVINELIKDEIADAGRYADVLRRNSCATRALSIYAKSRGGDYLIKTLREPLLELDENMEWFEIEKLTTESENVDTQVDAFLNYLVRIVDKISTSLDYFPKELIHICQTIYNSVKSKFPDYSYISVGSFVFLRFIGPALVTPDSEDILTYCDSRSRRSYITIAKVIQAMANNTEGYLKWPVLSNHLEILSQCKTKIYEFLKSICNYDKPIDIKVRMDDVPQKYDYNYIHRFIYLYDYELRNETLCDIHSISELKIAKETFTLFDDILGVMGQPAMEITNEIPKYIKENIDRYPQLYEFMNRHGYRISQEEQSKSVNYIHESMSHDGCPIMTVTFNLLGEQLNEMELLVYRVIQLYARIWTNKYYLVFDCTEFSLGPAEFNKLCNMLCSLLPNMALQNCIMMYYVNTTEEFMNGWMQVQEMGHPLSFYQIPQQFINTNTDVHIVKSLQLNSKNSEVYQNVRVSLHDIQLYDEKSQQYVPVKLKLGDRYFQILFENPKIYTLEDVDKVFEVKFNNVYEITDIDTIHVTTHTYSPTEFTIEFFDGDRLILSTSKYLEIVKMFYYAQSKLQSENYNQLDLVSASNSSNSTDKGNKERNEIISHLCLIILVGLFNEDDTVKHISYNLMVATQNAFGLNFGTKFYNCSEIYVPEDTTSFLTIVTKSLCSSSPELTPYIWRYMVDGLESDVIKHDSVPTIICCLSLWVPTMYDYVYLMDVEDGPELVAKIIRTLIRLTVSDSNFTTLYLQQIWYRFALDGRLTKIIVDEIVNHALERDSENKDWKKATVLLTCFPTIEIASQIVKRFIRIIRSFLPSLKLESSTRGWSEITILAKLSVALFFESPLLCQMYLSEILFIISLLIDIGPTDLRLSLHKFLMNICHSLTLNKSLSDEERTKIQKLSNSFSRQKITLMSGSSGDKSLSVINFSSPTLSSKFGTLEHFVDNILELMECNSPSEAAQWKTKYKKHLMNSIFTHHSFLSARAMMILGILGKREISEILCKDLLVESMKVFATPILTDETLTLTVAHSFTYSKIVEGLEPSLELVKQLFWFSTTILESPYQVQFESGMFFMINCLTKLYDSHFATEGNTKRLPEILMDSRIFASNFLAELESIAGVTWTNSNFPHILIGFIMRGLSIPVLKAASMECLKSLFRNSYLEMEKDSTTKTFFCYLFTIYLLFSPEQFMSAVNDANLSDDLVKLDDNNQIPRQLAEWLTSDHMCSNVALYQGALLFSSSISDDGCKLRFALIMRYLLKTNPICLFRFYIITRDELRRISGLEQNHQTVIVAFDIIGMLVTFEEYTELERYHTESLDALAHRGLTMISKIDIFDSITGDSRYMVNHNYSKVIYERKRLLTMILARMTCYI
ncbi:similar to Saccharomyces cerevisiae YBR140C IRA1 GTPase-activating protein that negatively regulates RAS by converting it from the GTP-to the GDP-bound inactive form [Maudiozyma saulgeensis]|uniref:Similar to Saccharomyces cerevisiae YBR140C IRA1 GTPase-activating protein that negatively regulates RAS by converting it from the GTP-to the GDP-bound inactive form n=1 Tax=Maudiozyma saulgeensis TaxID=1789683 RepID=A0A1X7R1L5_9SACH|nr:similar to Saccharomyces cerevisiae YBR140C IRA1 GTPase-activating protein that negatively regulates RAS by converting it from the GTP-to the GDP-bound inactive form [Kazachstania saulgeensis]